MGLQDVLNNNNNNDSLSKTKKKLDKLKQTLISSNEASTFDAGKHIADPTQFPGGTATVDTAVYIDYDSERKNHKQFAIQLISNIITNYVKSIELLDSPRLKDVKQQHILKLSELYLLVSISEKNLIMLQEGIDRGDLSKDMFNLVDDAQSRMLDNIDQRDKHIEKCESYWKVFANSYSLEINEESIIQKQQEAIKDDKKLIVTNLSDLNSIIAAKMQDMKKENP
jgi:hypothetical protein